MVKIEQESVDPIFEVWGTDFPVRPAAGGNNYLVHDPYLQSSNDWIGESYD